MPTKGKGPLAAIFGKAKGGEVPPEADTETDLDSPVPEDFEDYALTAFPELEGSSDRLEALYKAVKACRG